MRKCKIMVSAIVAWAAASNSASAQTKPHILLLMTDQQRAMRRTVDAESRHAHDRAWHV